MQRRHLLALALLALVGLVFPVVGQDKDKGKSKETPKDQEKVTLQWKFTKDKVFYQTMRTETKQSMKVMNNDVSQTQKQTFYFAWTPVKQEGTNWVIRQKIEGVAMDIDIAGSKISYDSTKETTSNNPLGEFFKALVGAEFTLTLDTKTWKVTKVEGREEFVKKLVAANPQMKPLLERILSEDALKEMAEPTFGVVPNNPVGAGETWTRTSTLDMGPIGRYENGYKYTYEGKEKDQARIKVDTTLKYSVPDEKAGVGGLPFKIKGGNLTSSNGGGTVSFNIDKGRVDRSALKLDLKGDLSIEIGGQVTKVDLTQTQETNVETSDENPVKKK